MVTALTKSIVVVAVFAVAGPPARGAPQEGSQPEKSASALGDRRSGAFFGARQPDISSHTAGLNRTPRGVYDKTIPCRSVLPHGCSTKQRSGLIATDSVSMPVSLSTWPTFPITKSGRAVKTFLAVTIVIPIIFWTFL